MSSIDRFTAAKAFAVGAAASGANPKNLVFAVGAAASIAQTAIPGGGQALAYAIFAIVGTLGVALPAVLAFAVGERAGPILDDLKSWMVQNAAVIGAVLCLVIGAKLVGDALAGLA